MSVLFVEYPRCSTCRKAKTWLEEHGIEFSDRHIVDEPLSEGEILELHKRSGLPWKRFFNTSGMRYRELNLKDELAAGVTDERAAEILASDGMLVKRPLLAGPDFVLTGFKEADWAKALGVE